MMSKKFSQMWSNQTELGKKFGISAIAVGKLLMEAGLKDPATKLASQKALDEEYAKSTPLKDGTPYFMWNIDKVRGLIEQGRLLGKRSGEDIKTSRKDVQRRQ